MANSDGTVNSPDHCGEPGTDAFPFEEAALPVEKADPLNPSCFSCAGNHQREHQRRAAVIQGEDQVGPRHGEEGAEHRQLRVTMIDDYQFQARVDQGIYLSALAVGDQGDLGIWIQPAELKKERGFQYVVAKCAKT